MAEIATIEGVTMSASMTEVTQDAIDRGSIAATHEAVKDFVQLIEPHMILLMN